MRKKIIRYVVCCFVYLFIEWLLLGFGKNWLALLFGVLPVWCPYRYFFLNFDRILRSFIVNTINFFRYKEYNYPKDIGTISVYVAHTDKVFGCCKTLSGAYYAYRLYNRYNGVKTFDYRTSNPKWITWKVRIISNLDIKGIPVIKFENLDQLVKLSEEDNQDIYTIVLIDEVNAIFNSRSFKTNFQNEEQIKTLVTCRHSNMQMIFIGQRYKYLDAMIRSISDRVYECVHIPILNTVVQYVYSAYDLETCDNPRYIKRLGLKFTYIHDWVYKLYDTKALVSLIAKSPSSSSDEVLSRKLRSGSVYDTRHLTRKGKKMIKG